MSRVRAHAFAPLDLVLCCVFRGLQCRGITNLARNWKHFDGSSVRYTVLASVLSNLGLQRACALSPLVSNTPSTLMDYQRSSSDFSLHAYIGPRKHLVYL